MHLIMLQKVQQHLKSETETLKENISDQEIDESININSDVGAAETLINDQDDSLNFKK